MKIVQTFWSKPTLLSPNSSLTGNGGWLDKKYHYMSWALSCLTLNQQYKSVELVTDKLGNEILINILGLPYSKVHISLDCLNRYPSELWAIGKIHSYGSQGESFLHVDSDVYIWDKINTGKQDLSIIVQNIESGEPYQKEMDKIYSDFKYIPNSITQSIKKNNKIISINAGVLGGSQLNFFRDFKDEAFKLIDENLNRLQKINLNLFNNIFEQCLLYSMIEQHKFNISPVISNVSDSYEGLVDFFDVPNNTKYIHALGQYKKTQNICDHLAFRLQHDFPKFYYKVINSLSIL